MKTFYNVVNAIACVAGVERGRGYGEREKGRGVGNRGKGTPAIRTPLIHFCGRWCPQISDWLSRNE